jgi:hypothetical protein
MPPGEVEKDGGVIERSMADQHVNGAQVRSCFEQVGYRSEEPSDRSRISDETIWHYPSSREPCEAR